MVPVVPSGIVVVVVLSTGSAASVHYDMLPLSSLTWTSPTPLGRSLFLSLDASLISHRAVYVHVECDR
jgi:hypothetical protein